jgi:hypothetical protein
MKPTNVRYQAATRVNAVSPEIVVVAEADSLHALEGSMVANEMASLQPLHRDLRQWHDIERIALEPGRPWQVFRERKYLLTSRKGKEVETPARESDMPIVAMKQGNACGAKGHALSCRGLRHIY